MKRVIALVVGLCLFGAACSDDGPQPGPTCEGSECDAVDVGEDVLSDMSQLDDQSTMTSDSGDEACVRTGCPDGLVCNSSTGACQMCEFNEECGPNAKCLNTGQCECESAFHLCEGLCVDSSDVLTCGQRCEPCEAPVGATAQCIQGECEVLCPGGLTYDEANDACVGCVDNTECTDAFEPRCDNGSCVGCTENADCAHLGDRSLCDEEIGRCVECLSDGDCGGNSCDLGQGRCTNTPLDSVGNCRPCATDSECRSGFACVPMTYDGQARNSAYCLQVKQGECEVPGFRTTIARTSVNGEEPREYCGILESHATCEAVLDYGKSCASNADCGATGLSDGLCDPVEFEPGVHCTYRCDESDECTNGLTGFVLCMSGNQGIPVCGGF